jgi:uncharacterized protein (TIGR02271 family)
MFSSRADAERAAEQLRSQLSLTQGSVRLSPEAGSADSSYDQSRPYEETGFFASLKNLFLPDEDRYAYAEGLRRGNVLVSAQVDEAEVDRAADLMEHAGAVDLDQQEASWRQSGWTGYNASQHAAAMPAASAATMATSASAATAGTAATMRGATAGAATGAVAGRDEVISVIEERLVVGKREVDRGRVRVRSYIVERPVEAEVRLHEERVQVERRPVDRPLTEADRVAAFQERVIEASATAEEAVVGKEARVVEEIAVHKEVADRTETVHDTVRRTEVEVDEGEAGRLAAGTAAAGTRTTGTTTAGATTSGTTTGTGVGAAVDRTLGTNISGTNPSKT